MSEKNDLLVVEKVEKTYGEGQSETKALKGVDLSIKKGQFVAIIGKSGSGKSTLLNILSGIDKPTSGRVVFDGDDITGYSEKQLSVWRGKNIGIVFQFFQLMPTLTVKENIVLPIEFVSKYEKSVKSISSQEKDKKVTEIMKLVGIEHLENKFPSEISGGEQQRTAVARALVNDPKLIIADEPTGNLDTETTEQVMQLFESLIKDGKTILMVTHNNELAERADRIITIKDGNILSDISKR
ncbi:ABC transporter ATP-binding protein [uncultured Ruminococcus sp.]|uniref:ABC transporter ATP-binding protein n=1 Tax=uncultured Ruminococcus sp. TaxID=165186 RepID=UPI0026164AF3|nr:ABC transporter ATP-binding protein [uncultured Ruminococcus sp.]